MDRSNPYEAAFEAYLQHHGLCTVAVDETRRALWGATPIKSLDFIVLGQRGPACLVDVKGRQFPGGPAGRERYVWENWSTQEDLAGMAQWIRLFGPGSVGLFVFLYHIGPTVALPAGHARLVDLARAALSSPGRDRRELSPAHEDPQPQVGDRVPSRVGLP